MKSFLCLLAGIHNIPNSPRAGEEVIAETKEEALVYAADRYGLHDVPEGSVAMPRVHPTLGNPS